MAALSEGAQPVQYNRTRLFVASCIALVTTAMTFAIRADVLDAFGREFGLSRQQEGWISLITIWGFPLAILFGGPLCDAIGMGRLLRAASIGHIVGVILTILSTWLGFPTLLAAALVLGLANGLVEAVINPLAATIYADQKTHRLNVLHAFWPAGLVIGGLVAMAISAGFGLGPSTTAAVVSMSWKFKYATILIAAILYLILLIGQKFPPTERVQHGVSTGRMFAEALRPGFILLLILMCFTAITELGPDQWVGSVLKNTVPGLQSGIIFLVYTSGFMFLLRFFAGPLVHKLSPTGLLCFCSALCVIGLFGLSYSFAAGTAFLAATVFAIGKTYFWPTMLGVTSERYPMGGSLLLALMGAAGNFAAGGAGPIMGGIYDAHTIEHLSTPGVKVAVLGADGKTYNVRAAESIKTIASKEDPAAELHIVADAVAKADAGQKYGRDEFSPDVWDLVKGGNGEFDAAFAKTLVTISQGADPGKDIKAYANEVKEAEKQGAAATFRYVALLPIVLVVAFGLMTIYFVAKGGYKPVKIAEDVGAGKA